MLYIQAQTWPYMPIKFQQDCIYEKILFLFQNKKIFQVFVYLFNGKQKKIFQTTPHKISWDFAERLQT